MITKHQEDTYRSYMKEVNKYPVLSRQEEKELALKFKKSQDPKIAQAIICANLRFVVQVANKYTKFNPNVMDLIQEGNIGLMMALKKFEPQKNYKFISYAVWWIKAYIQNFIIDNSSVVRFKQKRILKLVGRMNSLKKNNVDISNEEIAKELGTSSETIDLANQHLANSQWFEIDDVNNSFKTEDNQEEVLATKEKEKHIQDSISNAFKSLNEREKYIVYNRLMSDEPQKLKEIGNKFNISRERARQIEVKAIDTIKKYIKKEEQYG